ncbi:MAG: inositol monophosphatase [Candidatus Firestonebacteria bacterium]|nr:inositol monophosphatase [Candidatus Firestonebacteria bacterium]
MNKFESVAIQAAMYAGKLQRNTYQKSKKIHYKGEINLVTDIDLKCEKIIKRIILKNFPDHSILAEESDEKKTISIYRWIIDPLDGTTNFAHGYPVFCVSIALEKQGEIILGVIFDPVKNELFLARKGRGAFLNGKKIKVSNIDSVTKSLLVTGFPYDIREDNNNNNLNYFSKMSLSAQAVRRDGSAALDLAYIACGRFDGYWELKLSPWDIASGILLIEEAGGKATDISGGKISLNSRTIVSSNGKIHQEMIDILGK